MTVFKQCACSQQYTADEWAQLPRVGTMRRRGQPSIDLRNCSRCGSTLAVEVPRKPSKPTRLITASSVRCFRACQRKYRFAYVDGVRPVREQEALRFGTLWHHGMEAWWQRREWTPGEADPFDLAKTRALLAGYSARWSLDGIEVVAIEQTFRAPLRGVRGWSIGGKVDGIVRLDGRLLLLEHKTSSEDVSAGSDYWARLTIDTQVSIYYDGAAALGHRHCSSRHRARHREGPDGARLRR